MAINYSYLFSTLGEIVQAIEEFEAFTAEVEARRTTMVANLNATGVTTLITQVNLVFEGF